MSDLAPFVAAALRDKVITDLIDELENVKLESQKQRDQSQLVSITGPRGVPVYAETSFRDGNYDTSSPEMWKVEFPKASFPHQNERQQPAPAAATLSELADMEVRIGGICKARLGESVEGFVNDIKNNYNHKEQSGAVSIWFGGSSGIWLNIRVSGIDKANYAALRDFDLTGWTMLETMLQFWNANAKVSFTEVSFLISHINDAMDQWGIPTEPPPVYKDPE
eukprot:scaffold1901_cov126-Cylindrotheca_fusiformis.AAC.5